MVVDHTGAEGQVEVKKQKKQGWMRGAASGWSGEGERDRAERAESSGCAKGRGVVMCEGGRGKEVLTCTTALRPSRPRTGSCPAGLQHVKEREQPGGGREEGVRGEAG